MAQREIDVEFMREALAEAAAGRDSGDQAIGCVIAFDGEIIARAHNTVYSTRNRLAHAEVNAILQMQPQHYDYTGKEFTLYTTLEPCPMCFGAILSAHIRHVVAGANFDNSGASAYLDHLPEFFRQDHYKVKFKTGVLARDCADMWATGKPAKKWIEQGVVDPTSWTDLTNDDVKTYSTPSVKELD